MEFLGIFGMIFDILWQILIIFRLILDIFLRISLIRFGSMNQMPSQPRIVCTWFALQIQFIKKILHWPENILCVLFVIFPQSLCHFDSFQWVFRILKTVFYHWAWVAKTINHLLTHKTTPSVPRPTLPSPPKLPSVNN